MFASLQLGCLIHNVWFSVSIWTRLLKALFFHLKCFRLLARVFSSVILSHLWFSAIWTRVLKVLFFPLNVLVCGHVCFIHTIGLSEFEFLLQCPFFFTLNVIVCGHVFKAQEAHFAVIADF